MDVHARRGTDYLVTADIKLNVNINKSPVEKETNNYFIQTSLFTKRFLSI